MAYKSYRGRADVIPFEGASDLHHRLARSFALVTDWMGAWTGHYSPQDVMATLASQTQASTVMIYRVDLLHNQADTVIAHSRLSKPGQARAFSSALARHICARHDDDLTPGSVRRGSDLAREPDFAGSEAEREWQARSGIAEIVFMVLENTDTRCDILEISLEGTPDTSPELPSVIVARALADVWALKAPGVIAGLIAEEKRRGLRPGVASASIFDARNPYGLTRAEIAVCRLLSTGQPPKAIADSLNVSIATVRTHLRNLYSKTGASGQVALISLAQQEPVEDD